MCRDGVMLLVATLIMSRTSIMSHSMSSPQANGPTLAGGAADLGNEARLSDVSRSRREFFVGPPYKVLFLSYLTACNDMVLIMYVPIPEYWFLEIGAKKAYYNACLTKRNEHLYNIKHLLNINNETCQKISNETCSEEKTARFRIASILYMYWMSCDVGDICLHAFFCFLFVLVILAKNPLRARDVVVDVEEEVADEQVEEEEEEEDLMMRMRSRTYRKRIRR